MRFIIPCFIVCSLGVVAVAQSQRVPTRTKMPLAFQYTGGVGLTTFVQSENRTWVVYPANKRTQVYVEVGRNRNSITLRRANTTSWFRLHSSHCETRKGEQGQWRRLARGVWLTGRRVPAFEQFGGTDYRLRVVYLVPRDRKPKPDYEKKIKVVLSLAAELYVKDLREKGYETNGLKFEAANGRPVIHLLRSDKPASYFNNAPKYDPNVQFTLVGREILNSLGDPARHIVIVFAETYEEGPAREAWVGHIARGAAIPPDGGLAVYSTWFLKDDFCALSVEAQKRLFFDATPIEGRSAFGHRGQNSPRFEFIEDGIGALCHELGHALGAPHDQRNNRVYIMGNGFRNLRWNFDPSANDKVAFSDENARLLMSSRYLAKDLTLSDYDNPKVEMELANGRDGGVDVTITATDDLGLRSMVLVERMRPSGSVIMGQELSGKRRRIQYRLPDHLLKGKYVKLETYVADNGGNYGRVTKTLQLPAARGN